MSLIVVVDYGVGNVRSVAKALEVASPGSDVRVSGDPSDIDRADRIVLPGQGSMQGCMSFLGTSGLLEALLEAIQTKPILGTCVGAQMLFDWSSEGGRVPGLSLFPGNVLRLEMPPSSKSDDVVQTSCKIPHVGWNQVRIVAEHPLFKGIATGDHFYFVHSYYMNPTDLSLVVSETDYGTSFVSAVARDNIFAVQFHPEKSSRNGLLVYKNFVHWSP